MEQTAGTFTKESEVVIVAEKNSDVGYHGEHLLSRIIMIINANLETAKLFSTAGERSAAESLQKGKQDEPLVVRDFRIRNSNKSYRPINFRKRLFHILDRVSFWLQRADQAAIF